MVVSIVASVVELGAESETIVAFEALVGNVIADQRVAAALLAAAFGDFVGQLTVGQPDRVVGTRVGRVADEQPAGVVDEEPFEDLAVVVVE